MIIIIIAVVVVGFLVGVEYDDYRRWWIRLVVRFRLLRRHRIVADDAMVHHSYL
jgi:hypothetical protein